MRKTRALLSVLFLFVLLLASGWLPLSAAAEKQLVYDEANLLSQEEKAAIEEKAAKLSEKRQTDFIVVTTKSEKDVKLFTQDFYDDMAPGFDKPHGNAAILTVNMEARETYLAGFYKAEKYLDDSRMDKINADILPLLGSEDYYGAMSLYLDQADRYMNYVSWANPDWPIFDLWFQVLVAVAVGGIVVGILAINSGGKRTVDASTYLDGEGSGVLQKHDRYIKTVTTKTKKPEKSSGGGGFSSGGGGGRTGGGHSHSGSRGSF